MHIRWSLELVTSALLYIDEPVIVILSSSSTASMPVAFNSSTEAVKRSHSLIRKRPALMICDVPSARPHATDTTGIRSGHCEASIVAGLIVSQTTLIPSLVSTISPPICSIISKIARSP